MEAIQRNNAYHRKAKENELWRKSLAAQVESI